jgi:hypothetical protein
MTNPAKHIWAIEGSATSTPSPFLATCNTVLALSASIYVSAATRGIYGIRALFLAKFQRHFSIGNVVDLMRPRTEQQSIHDARHVALATDGNKITVVNRAEIHRGL